MPKDIFYFSHDSNARNDEKIVEIRMNFGWEGYGLYFAIIETLREQENYTYPSNAIAKLAFSFNIGVEKLKPIYESFFSTGLLIEKDGVFYSESLMKRMEKIDESRAKRAAAGRKGGIAKAKAQQSSGKKRKKSKIKKGNNIDPNFEKFWEIYQKKGNKKSSYENWLKLSEKQKTEVFEKVHQYVKSTPNLQYRKNAEVYLNPSKEQWNNKIINGVETQQQDMFNQNQSTAEYMR